jgi:putative membrane protein insertion efficiency factor
VKSFVLALIRFYQACLSPLLPFSCRYYPSCSAYAYDAVEKWGLRRGLRMALERLLRCRPLGGGGYDPVPLRSQDLGAAIQTSVPGTGVGLGCQD